MRGAAVRAEVREVQGWFSHPVQLRRHGRLLNPAEPLSSLVRRHLLVPLHLERHSGLQLQPVLRPLQVRKHERRLLHHLHQRRQQVLRHAAGLLRLPGNVLQERLLLLRLLRQHLLLLRHVRGLSPGAYELKNSVGFQYAGPRPDIAWPALFFGQGAARKLSEQRLGTAMEHGSDG
jgi:hypothetical protein